MSTEIEKMILEQLSHQNTPISLTDLITKMDRNYPERTVRRWLSKFVASGLVVKLGEKRGSKYLLKRESESQELPGISFSTQASDATLKKVRPILDIYEFSYQRTFGYDEVRVRYRQQRRNILRHIILNKLKDRSMLDYIQMQTNEWIPPESRELFKEDVLEDIQELSPPRIAGLGITLEDLMEYTKPN